MAATSVVKIPCIFAATYALHVIHTAPTALPPKDELVSVPGRWERLLDMSPYTSFLRKGTFWAVSSLEAFTILASRFPDNPGVQRALEIVMRGHSAERLCITPWSTFGFVLIISGSFLRWRAFRTLDRFFTYRVSIRKDHRLMTTGPYSIVRHPSYLGMVTAFVGIPFWYCSEGSWLRESGVLDTTIGRIGISSLGFVMALVQIGLLKRMSMEDRILKKNFGKEWEEWATRVPYRVLPGIY